MARIEWVERRLINWAEWRLRGRGGGVLGYAAVDLGAADNGGRRGYVEAAVPVLEVDAELTERAVRSLQADQRRSVEAWYLRSGGKDQAALRAGCSASTMFARVDVAHVRLAAWFGERAEAARAERARVEALQRGTVRAR